MISLTPRKLLAATILVVHVVLLVHLGRHMSVTVDEGGHVAAGVDHWKTGRFGMYRVNPPLSSLIATIPVVLSGARLPEARAEDSPGARPEALFAWSFANANADRYVLIVRLARLAGIFWSLAGALLCAVTARAWFGKNAALLALAIWCFEPTLVSHAALATPDLPATVTTLAVVLASARFFACPSLARTLTLALVLGVAHLTKLTSLAFFGLLPLLLGIRAVLLRRARAPGAWRTTRAAFVRLGVAFALSLVVLNAGYLFRGSGRPLGSYAFVSEALHGIPTERTPLAMNVGNRFRGTALGRVPVPLPVDYVHGLDLQRRDFERGLPSYLRGEWRTEGWSHFYVYALAVKLPLGFAALFAAGIVATLVVLVRTVRARSRESMRNVLILVPAAVLFALVSSQTGFTHHVRYVLPTFPFLAIAASRLAPWALGRLGRTAFVVVAATHAIVSVAGTVPNTLAYFNELAGGPANGAEHLLFSNVDAGQDLLALAAREAKNRDARPLHLAYYGAIDPKVVGLAYTLPPIDPRSARARMLRDPDGPRGLGDEVGPKPGRYAVSVSFLKGLTFLASNGRGGIDVVGGDAYRYFALFSPVGRVGASIWLYDISPADAEQARAAMQADALASTNRN